MKKLINNRFSLKIPYILFGFFLLAWHIINVFNLKDDIFVYSFNSSYGLIALFGGVWGLLIAHNWGFHKSTLGKAVLFFSLGLLSQEFGQLVFSAYNVILRNEVPYPSLADVGFFATIPFYIVGMHYLNHVAGVRFTLHKIINKLQIVLLPLAMLTISYYFFLQGYEFDWSDPIKIFLDFGYPLGQAFFVSQALILYSLSQKILGGVMKGKVLFFVFALIAQFVADYNFLYQSSRGTWENAAYGDLLYLISYFLMTIALLQLNTVFVKLKHQK